MSLSQDPTSPFSEDLPPDEVQAAHASHTEAQAGEIPRLEAAVTALEAQRDLLGEVVVNAALAPLREKLDALRLRHSNLVSQRKLITVLFADVTGFTAMGSGMDAEDLAVLLNSVWQRLDHVVLEHGGRIDKHIGDAVMALWGADQAREDDAEQALRAALQMREEISRGSKVSRKAGPADGLEAANPDLQLRIGINTGPALLGVVATTHEFTAMGDTVNIASRLQHAAQPGDVLISHATYRHVRGLFEVEPQEPLTVKGKPDPLRTYRVLRTAPRQFHQSTRGVEGIETRTIGREAELLILQETYQDAVESRETRLLTVVGEPGIGKSRLLFEFEKWVSQLPRPPQVFRSRLAVETMYRPAGLLHTLFSDRFHILDTDPPETVRDKFTRGISAWTASDKALIIGQIAGFDFSADPGVAASLRSPGFDQMALSYMAAALQEINVAAPLLLLLEDIHWADERSLMLLTRLLSQLPSQALLVICLARPALYERIPGWDRPAVEGESLPRLVRLRMDLRPLSTRYSRQLVSEILQRVPDLPDAFRDTIVQTAEGNPFYIEEMIKMLLDQGVILRGAQPSAPWLLQSGRLDSVEIPPTLTGVLQARLDSLPPAEKLVLQRAAVIGRTFWDAAVEMLGQSEGEPGAAAEDWEALLNRELIFRRERSAFAGVQEYIFKHALLRDVAYESVLKRLRRQYHRKAAEWLVQTAGERCDEYADLIAGHWEKAGEPQLEAEWQGRAGLQAARQHAHSEALRRLQRALELLPPEQTALRFKLLLSREQVHHLQGSRQAQALDLTDLADLADHIADPTSQAEAALRRSAYAEATGDYAVASQEAQRAVQLATSVQDNARLAEAHLGWGRALWRLADYTQAQQQLELALVPARAAGAKREEMNLLRNLGNVAWGVGDYPAARLYYQRALRLADTINDTQGAAAAHNNLALVANQQGDYAEARRTYSQALQLYREIGDRKGEGLVLYNLGIVARSLGNDHAGQDYFVQALERYRLVQDRQGEAAALSDLGRVQAALGDFDAARHSLEQSLAITRRIGERRNEGNALSGLGYVDLNTADYAGAMKRFSQAFSIFQEIGDRRGESNTLPDLGYVYTILGRFDLAQAACEQAEQVCRLIRNQRGESWTLAHRGVLHLYQSQPEQALQRLEAALTLAGTCNEVQCMPFALTNQGHALAALGRFAAAQARYEQALAQRDALNQPSQAAECRAALAMLMLMQGRPEAALAVLESSFQRLEHSQHPETTGRVHSKDPLQRVTTSLLWGAEEPLRWFYNAYLVLQAAADHRASALRRHARRLLENQAARLDSPESRQAFLENPPHHRELLK